MAPNPQSLIPDPELDVLVRRVDEDRWLASRFAPAHVRARLMAVYALNYEIARTAELVTQEAIGDIRLAWWREALDEIYAGRPARAHPALAAFAAAAQEAAFSRAVLDAMIEARGKDLEAHPFAFWSDADAYVDATAGGVMRLAVEACGEARSPQVEAFVRRAAAAWGFAGLLRAAPYWRARGRSSLPRGAAPEAMLERARAGFTEARTLARALAPALFPAVGYVALLPAYARALERGGEGPSLISRQITLIAAAATGRI